MMTTERIREGTLVKGTTDVAEARCETGLSSGEALAGWFRKVPGQWSSFVLYDATAGARGAFPAVIIYDDPPTV